MRRESFQQMVLGQKNIYMQKNEVGALLHIIHKINSKWIRNLKVIANITKLLGKKVRTNLSDFGFGYGFLDMTLIA